MSENNGVVKNSKLTQSQAFRVMQWIGVNKERILKELPGYEEASKWAAEQLGFTVTKHNLQSVARDSDQSWVPKPNDRNGKGYSVLANVANRVSGMVGQLDECKKFIEQLLTDNQNLQDRKSTRLNSSHIQKSRMPSSA